MSKKIIFMYLDMKYSINKFVLYQFKILIKRLVARNIHNRIDNISELII